MLNKRIKSVLIAGIVILGMGFAKVDSYAAELSADNPIVVTPGTNKYAIDYQNGEIQVRIDYLNGEYTGTTYINTYTFCTTWKKELYKVNEIEIKYTINDGEERLIEKQIENQSGLFSFNQEFEPGVNVKIKSVKLDYDLLTIEEKIINRYLDYMNTNNIGTKDDSGIRTIGKEFAISRGDWESHINKLEESGGFFVGVTLDDDGNSGEYEIYSMVSGDLIETVKIEFFDAKGAKGWVPEITPGTGQALAVGGIVIGAAAAVGLLINNRKKDEE